MQHYSIPCKYDHTICDTLKYKTTNVLPKEKISHSLSFFLMEIKERIETHAKDWDKFKKYTNPYEYIHSVIPYKKRAISKYRPLSRSYFKMIELVNTFDLFDQLDTITTFHLAEGPGGFIEAIAGLRNNINQSKYRLKHDVSPICDLSCINYLDVSNIQPSNKNMEITETLQENIFEQTNEINYLKNSNLTKVSASHLPSINMSSIPYKKEKIQTQYQTQHQTHPYMKNDKYIGMTIIDENDANVPSWKKSETFLKATEPNVQIERGMDGTGNILSFENFVYCSQKYSSSMDIITADGGFDFSIDFNNQEINIARLLFAQICYALCMQKMGGHFILKIFDIFFQHSIDMIYLLSCFYDSIKIVKPQSSRIANSEKYVVCKGFRYKSNRHFIDKIERSMYDMTNEINETTKNNCPLLYVERILNINIPSYFISRIEEINSIFGQQQIENIHYTLLLIDKNIKQEKIETIIRPNINKCIQWCEKYGIPHIDI